MIMKRIFMKLLAHQTLFIFFISSITLSQYQIGSDIDGEAATDRFGSSISISSKTLAKYSLFLCTRKLRKHRWV